MPSCEQTRKGLANTFSLGNPTSNFSGIVKKTLDWTPVVRIYHPSLDSNALRGQPALTAQ